MADAPAAESLLALPAPTLAALGREYMLFGHLLNRAGLPHVHMRLGPKARETIAIEEWMGASPVYTQRMQRAMRFAGDDVGTIMKGLQLDVGFAHRYMDVRYELQDVDRGRFWLASCGALLELEPHGPEAVRSMCHAIEDPTFDATAVATNPRARCRPIHRPPRVPSDRTPHCLWEIFIDPEADPVREIPLTGRVRASRLAAITFPDLPDPGGDGWADYAGRFDPDFQLERLSRGALVRVCLELLVQDHLLVRALMMAIADRSDAATTRAVAMAQWMGAGAVASRRVHAALGVAGDDVGAIARTLAYHPAFVPGYVRVGLAVDSPARGRLWIEDCDGLHEGDAYSWFAMLDDAPHPALDAMVQAVNPRARCITTAPSGAARYAWDLVVDEAAEPAPVPPEVAMVAGSGAARFDFGSAPASH